MNKPRYESPVIVRHQTSGLNKFSRAAAMRPASEIDGVPVTELVERYGSPLFVFSERTLLERYRDLRDAFSVRWPRVRIAWSYKTNYLDGICRLLQREGAWAEVVSEFEYAKARRLGLPPERIHFNGPHKSESTLEEVLAAGAHVHLDHLDELALAERIAQRLEIRPRVSIRINLSVDGVPPWSRFGFNLENGQARSAVDRLLAGDRLELEGIHCHLGTFIDDVAPYREAARKLSEFANELSREHGVELDFIDLGGGFASHNTLKANYLPGAQATPSFARYAEAIGEGLAALKCSPRNAPVLVLETGRALVDDAGHLVTTVVANKRLPDGRRGVILDAGTNILFTSFWYKHDVVPAQPFHGLPEPTVLYGPLCMNIDVVRDTFLFPPVKPGDQLVIHNVGAYNVTQWMQFITYRPAVVLVRPDKTHALIRRRETLEDVVGPEELPEWLS